MSVDDGGEMFRMDRRMGRMVDVVGLDATRELSFVVPKHFV